MEFLEKDSIFLVNDKRAKRWAIPYNHEATNARADVLLAKHKQNIEGKRVLDLGCHFGTFSYIAHQLGARYILGIDSDKKLIEQANSFFEQVEVQKDTYTFLCTEVTSYLESLPEKSFDTIFCFGLLYYIPDVYHFLSLLKKVAKEVIILDTFTAYYCAVQGKDSLQTQNKTLKETYELPLMFHNITKTGKTDYKVDPRIKINNKDLSFINCPTLSLLELYFQTLGLSFQELSWDTYIKNQAYDWEKLIATDNKIASHWSDVYSIKIRVSYRLDIL